jgi:prophage antirepressor-like protein
MGELVLYVDIVSESITPLVALFQEKGIRILGTVDYPLFCALDVARHIKDEHCERILHKLPDKFTRWGPACDALDRPQRSRFLTEEGLYKYLLQSGQKLAEPFQLFTYDLLTAERKRTVDGARLALKIERSRVTELEREKAAEKVLRRAERIQLTETMRAVNTARAELNIEQAQLAWYENGIDNVAAARDANEVQSGEAAETIDPSIITEAPAREEKAAEGAEDEDPMTPLVALFEARGVRIAGSVSEPLFCATDTAKYIDDGNSDRIFRDKTPDVYIRWGPLRDAQGQPRTTRFLTEAGLYRYLLRSKLEKAEPFQEFTYALLTAERKRTVDSARLALKIEQTKAEELRRQKAASRKIRRRERKQLNSCMQIANETRESLQKVKERVSRAQMKKAIESDKKAILRYCAPHAPPEFRMPVSGHYFEGLRLSRMMGPGADR